MNRITIRVTTVVLRSYINCVPAGREPVDAKLSPSARRLARKKWRIARRVLRRDEEGDAGAWNWLTGVGIHDAAGGAEGFSPVTKLNIDTGGLAAFTDLDHFRLNGIGRIRIKSSLVIASAV